MRGKHVSIVTVNGDFDGTLENETDDFYLLTDCTITMTNKRGWHQGSKPVFIYKQHVVAIGENEECLNETL